MQKLITSRQLKAARHVLNLGVRDLTQIIKISKTIINDAENDKTRDFFYKYSPALIDYFKSYNITFPSNYYICYKETTNSTLSSVSLSRFQLRASRSLLNMSQRHLASLIGVSREIMIKAEKLSNDSNIKYFSAHTTQKTKEFFLNNGVDFPSPLSVYYKNMSDKCF